MGNVLGFELDQDFLKEKNLRGLVLATFDEVDVQKNIAQNKEPAMGLKPFEIKVTCVSKMLNRAFLAAYFNSGKYGYTCELQDHEIGKFLVAGVRVVCDFPEGVVIGISDKC